MSVGVWGKQEIVCHLILSGVIREVVNVLEGGAAGNFPRRVSPDSSSYLLPIVELFFSFRSVITLSIIQEESCV